MKKDIHPKYEEITANCSCGNVMKIRSTVGHDLNWTCAVSATRSILASSVMLLPVAVLIASTSVSASRQQVSFSCQKKRLMALFCFCVSELKYILMH